MKTPTTKKGYTPLLLRVGLAFVFLYAAVASLAHPLEWAGYLPTFMTNIVSSTVAVRGLAVYELVLGTWLLSGMYVRYGALLSAATLGGIVAVSFSQLIVTFRDVGLLFAALALFFAET